jgi:uncharacterized protein (DUF362 family)
MQVSLSRAEQLPGTPLQYDDHSIAAVRRLLEECLSRLPGWPGSIPGATVLLKPNLVRPERETYRGICTDSRVILALVTLMKDAGARAVWVGDNPGVGFSSREAFRLANLDSAVARRGGVVRHFDEERQVDVHLDVPLVLSPVRVAAAAVEADVLVTVPKMKTHMHCTVSLGMKNLHGLLADTQRTIFHKEDIHLKIVDIVRAAPPDLTVVDALWPQEGQGPVFGTPIEEFNCVIAGWDVVATDSVAARVMGIEPGEIAALRVAEEVGMGGGGEPSIEGVETAVVARPFRRAVLSSQGAFPGVSVVDGGACSGCLSSLRHSLEALRLQGALERLVPLAVGAGVPTGTAALREGTKILLGDCYADACREKPDLVVRGCPPHAFELYRRILRAFLPEVPERF